MTCAKRQVTCLIELPNGDTFYGDNSVRNPQEVCPREEGEGYEKCITICDQPGHAEVMALKAAEGHDLTGGRAIVGGIDNICKNCQLKLYAAGIRDFSLK